MSDQGRWFKLWTTSSNDPDLRNLSLEDFGRWCLLGVFMKAHGTKGNLRIEEPGFALQDLFRVRSWDDVLAILKSFPNTEIRNGRNPVTVLVKWNNWSKFQSDTTGKERKKRFDLERSKKRGEEKRREEKRGELNSPINPPVGLLDGFDDFWKKYPRREGKGKAEESWKTHVTKKKVSLNTIMLGIAKWEKSAKWNETPPIIPMPTTWLNQRRWEDEPLQKNNRKVPDSEKAPGWDVGSQESFK